MRYPEHQEMIIVAENPAPRGKGKRKRVTVPAELPLGEYEDLRVRTVLLRHPDYGKFEKVTIGSAADAARLFEDAIDEAQEVFWVVLLDAKSSVLGIQEAHRGGKTSLVVDQPIIFVAAIVAGASRMIIVHNHPSGGVEPSTEDINLARLVERAATLLGIKLLDSIVIGRDADGALAYTSLAERGRL